MDRDLQGGRRGRGRAAHDNGDVDRDGDRDVDRRSASIEPAVRDRVGSAIDFCAGPPTGPARRSWQGAAGVVVAECQGGAISLASARPNSGWSIEVDKTGPDDLRVEFENADDGRVRVEATCAGGSPAFVVGD